MGERQSDGGPDGRRRAHPGDPPAAPSGPGRLSATVDTDGVEALLAAALIREVDAGAEQRAVAAFLAAREAGAHGARTRRRDDWRARRPRLGSTSLKATLSVLVAGLTLSGVAVAGIGATDPSPERPAPAPARTHAPPSAGAPAAPGSAAPEAGSGRTEPDRPGSAGDTEARCRAFERAGGRGRALESTAWKRLTEAAGGAAHVEAYCAEQLEQDTVRRPGSTPTPGNKSTGRAGGAENSSSGGAGGNAGRAGGNGRDGDSGGSAGRQGTGKP